MKQIDLRSDTVTRPTAAMREVMAAAEVGDDVYGEDPTVNQLEELGAGIVGKEAAVFSPSGTQSNLLALLSHCQRGDEYIVGQQAHTYKYEGGGAAVLGSIQPQPLDFEADGSLDLDRVERAIKPDDFHFARTRLLCLENTHNGLAVPPPYFDRAAALARSRGLKLHLDGARLFNAALRSGLPAAALAAPFDTVSICLSKGLGAPVGALLCGSGATITKARRWRKMLGGGMRQAGILAAAGIHALDHHIDRLQTDHDHARQLAAGLAEVPELTVEYDRELQTNMVFVTLPAGDAGSIQDYLRDHRIIVPAGSRIRLVTHLDIQAGDLDSVVSCFKRYYR